jgi:hypothetical protein
MGAQRRRLCSREGRFNKKSARLNASKEEIRWVHRDADCVELQILHFDWLFGIQARSRPPSLWPKHSLGERPLGERARSRWKAVFASLHVCGRARNARKFAYERELEPRIETKNEREHSMTHLGRCYFRDTFLTVNVGVPEIRHVVSGETQLDSTGTLALETPFHDQPKPTPNTTTSQNPFCHMTKPLTLARFARSSSRRECIPS